MTARQKIVKWFDDAAPGLIGRARYFYHVRYRGDVVYPKVSEKIFDRLQSKSRSAIDVGANVGIYSRYLSSKFSSVACVEPIGYLAKRLQEQLPRNCVIHAVALGEAEGSIVLRIPVDEAGNEMHALSTASPENKFELFGSTRMVERTVPVQCLDQIAGSIANVAFVKIDVEGFEGQVLAGASKLLHDVRPVFQVEISRSHNPNYKDVLNKFAAAKYDSFSLHPEGLRADALSMIEAQRIQLIQNEHASPEGCWDYLFVPNEKINMLVHDLIIK